ncbi:MAG: hypothetical protein IH867_12315 [Chloroflexi bacterium]|nr:hypothetical protein [Chloroflexota bacterium]
MSSQISERARSELELETLSLMVHLPLYLKLDDDYAGSARILTVLSDLYGFSRQLPEIEMAEKQYDQVTPAMNDNPALKDMVERFERGSDADSPGENPPTPAEEISLSPEIERFLSDVAQIDDDEDEDEDDDSG